ncbi:hypothetical protein ACW7BJ_14110 [Azospirillum argentinense]
MPVYLIHDDTVTAHTTSRGLPADALLIRSEEELAASGLSLPRLTALSGCGKRAVQGRLVVILFG